VVTPPAATASNQTAARRRAAPPKARLVVPLLLLTYYVLQCGWFVRTQSFTFDEPVHIVTGQDMWRHGRFELWNDHPPLGRLLCALPLVGSRWQVDVGGHFPEFRALAFHPDPEAMAWRGRVPSVLLGILLGVILWTTARRMFSEGAANFALAMFAFSPALIAHFSMVTTDGIGVLSIFATAVALVRWRRYCSRTSLLVLAVACGVLLLAKFYTPPMFVVAIIWVLISKPGGYAFNPLRWNWSRALLVGAIAFLLLWAGYFFHISHLSMRNGTMTATFPHREPIVKHMKTPVQFSIPVPAGEYLEGLRSVALHDHRGHQSFFMGRVSRKGGWKLYYPVVILLKWPTTVLVLFLALLLLAVRGHFRVPGDLLIMASFPAVYFLFAIRSHIDIGDRHVLPLYPFALLFVAGWWMLATDPARWSRAPQKIAPPGRVRILLVFLIAAVVLNACDALRYAPDYISYFSPFVDRAQSYKILSDSNLDWGQGLLALHSYQQSHPREKIYLSYFGSVEAPAYRLRTEFLAPRRQVSDATVVVSATQLTGQMNEDDPRAFRWVLEYPEREILNDSLHVFVVPEKQAQARGEKR
jgi:Dolichyl-phosphate-mannose-protein mannosyltransferase